MKRLNRLGVLLTTSSVALAKECKFAIDVVFVQDTTTSMEDDLPHMIKYAPEIVSTIQESNPGSRFGLSSFKDKKVSGEYCTRHESSLARDAGPLMSAYKKLKCLGNYSTPEDQYDGVINALYDSAMGWRPLKTSSQEDEESDEYVGARLIILHTDSVAHAPGDWEDWGWLDSDPELYPPNPWHYTPEQLCNYYDYPSDEHLKIHLRSKQTHLAILTPNDDSITSKWHQVNEDLLEQPEAFYQYIKSDSSDAAQKIVDAVASVTKFVCEGTSTTTTTTTTTKPTTTTTTTKPTTTTTTTKPTTTRTTTIPTTTTPPKRTTRLTALTTTEESTNTTVSTRPNDSTPNGDCTTPQDCTTQPTCVPKPDCHPNCCNQPIINIQVKEVIPKHMALEIDN